MKQALSPPHLSQFPKDTQDFVYKLLAVALTRMNEGAFKSPQQQTNELEVAALK